MAFHVLVMQNLLSTKSLSVGSLTDAVEQINVVSEIASNVSGTFFLNTGKSKYTRAEIQKNVLL